MLALAGQEDARFTERVRNAQERAAKVQAAAPAAVEAMAVEEDEGELIGLQVGAKKERRGEPARGGSLGPGCLAGSRHACASMCAMGCVPALGCCQ